VQLLTRAKVNFAVLGKKECCTGDTARRAGNEYLYRQLADGNVATLTAVRPKLIVATCPHCMNTIGKEYKQIGGDFKVVHHTEYLESLVAQGKLEVEATESPVTYHDPCYLGRHSGVYDAPRNVLKVLTNDFVELDRKRENSFCCGAGGAQFWKEEEAGAERISDNRYREAQGRLDGHEGEKVLAVGCPFCKSMLESTPGKGEGGIAVKDVAELMLESVLRRAREVVTQVGAKAAGPAESVAAQVEVEARVEASVAEPKVEAAGVVETLEGTPPVVRKKWMPKASSAVENEALVGMVDEVPKPGIETQVEPVAPVVARKKWAPKAAAASQELVQTVDKEQVESAAGTSENSPHEPVAPEAAAPARKKWEPKKGVKPPDSEL
jgi:hypothetical protein